MIEIESTEPEPTNWELLLLGLIRNVLVALLLPVAVIAPGALPGILIMITSISKGIHDMIKD